MIKESIPNNKDLKTLVEHFKHFVKSEPETLFRVKQLPTLRYLCKALGFTSPSSHLENDLICFTGEGKSITWEIIHDHRPQRVKEPTSYRLVSYKDDEQNINYQFPTCRPKIERFISFRVRN